ncbi:hypothetical protein ACKGJI_00405 [Sulfurospirillum sp. 1307]|jgi:hypothetical protein
MKYFMFFLSLFYVTLFASDDLTKERELIIQKNIQKAMEFEEKYAKEQMFYDEKTYDFNASKVDDSSLKYIKAPEPEDDFNMDDVYD